MGDNTVALAALGVLGTAIAAIIWVVKFALTRLANDLQEHTKSAIKQSESNDRVADAMKEDAAIRSELLTFMRKLNGRLPKLVEEKMQQASEEAE